MDFMDYISKKVEACDNLDDFILKLKQGKMVNIANGIIDHFFTLPISDTVKMIYCGFEYSGLYDDLSGHQFCGVLDCKSNKLFLYEDRCYQVVNSLNPQIKAEEFYSDPLKAIKKAGYDNKVVDFNTVIEQIDEILCRYQSDKDCESLEDKSLVKKDLSLDYEKEYDNIQKLAMGINNFLYISLERLREGESENENMLMSCVMGYLEEGLDYLKNVDTAKLYNYREKDRNSYSIISLEEVNEKHSELYKQYTDIKGNMDEIIKQEIVKALKDKGSVWINDNKFNDFSVDESTIWMYDNRTSYNKIEIPYQDINTIRYKGKEIFNRENVVERLSNPEYQAGIDSLIEFVSNNFDRYNNEGLDPEDIHAGNLVYSKDGHFGVMTAKDKVYLDNDIQADISNINICFKDNELDNGLAQVKNMVVTKYNNDMKKSIVKKQKRVKEKDNEGQLNYER